MGFALEIASTVLFAAHLLAVNLAMAGPILCIWLEWRSRRAGAAGTNDDCEPNIERAVAGWSLVALPVGLALGASLLGLLWLAGEKPYFAALAMIPRDRLLFAGGELVFYLAVMFAYRAIRRARPRRRWLPRLLAAASAANLMAHFPTLFAMMSVLSHRPETWSRSLDRGLYHSLLIDPEVASRVVHVWLAAVATAGIFVMLLAGRRARAGQSASDRAALERSGGPNESGSPGYADAAGEREQPGQAGRPGEPARPVAVGGAMWAFAASLAQLPVGLWALVAMPAGGGAAWSGDLAGLALLGAGVVAALKLVQQLAAAALGEATRRIARQSAGLLVLTVLLMCGASRHLRQAAQPPAGGEEHSSTAREPLQGASKLSRAAGTQLCAVGKIVGHRSPPAAIAAASSACQSTARALP